MAYNSHRYHLAILPLQIRDLEAADRPQAGDRTLFPYRWQSRQQFYRSILALYQHFGDTRSTAEITVDLERRMCIEQIRIGATATLIPAYRCQLIPDQFIGMIAILETSPQVDLPTHGPASADVSTIDKRGAGSRKKFWGSKGRDLVAWKYAPEV